MEQQTTPVKKQRILSGIQPSGTPTLGNYIGAMRNWKLLEDEYDCLYMIADLHAITVRQEPAKLRAQSIHLLALLLAIGLDPEKNVLFFQSHVHQHAEMNWLLNCYTYMGEMSRMTQFKEHTLLIQTGHELTFELASSDKTRAIWPYDFALRTTFTLEGRHVRHTVSVRNTGRETLRFGLGFHPGFTLPFDDKHTDADYDILFVKYPNSDWLP